MKKRVTVDCRTLSPATDSRMTKVEGMKGYFECPDTKIKFLLSILTIEDLEESKKLIEDLLKNCKAWCK